MLNLIKLTLPNFDQSLLAQHTAFGLCSLTLMSAKMSGDKMLALFTWLDSQINVSELKFPKLDDSTNEAPNQAQDATPPIHQHQPRNSVHLCQVPLNSGCSTSRPMTMTMTPLSPYFPDSRPISPVNPAVRPSLLRSPTPLPSLTTLHATPAIFALLQPLSAPLATEFSAALSAVLLLNTNTGHLSLRCLQNMYLNISTTLYTGLRPNTVMASLHSLVKKLRVRFGENVDKRTVEKVLGAIAVILGSGTPKDNSNDKNTGSRLDLEKGGGWRGLKEFEVLFRTKVVLMPGIEEMLYKSLQTTLPRYTHLCKLSLNFPSSSSPRKSSASFLLTPPITPPMDLEVALKGDMVLRFPVPPLLPLPLPSSVAGQGAMQQQAQYLKSLYLIQPIAAGALTAVCPSFDTIRGMSMTKRMSLFNVNSVQDWKVPRVVEGTWNQEQEQFEQEGGLIMKDKCDCKPASELSVPKTSVAISLICLLRLLLTFNLLSISISVNEPPSASVIVPPKPGPEQFTCPAISSDSSYSSFELKTPPYKHL
ncbi:hypothetical protein EST38_g11848 [Candolleomyces aberdarensis]|uniref:Uncharacterized protein n=1 Tax=Candolleomyces aberdarensis TaxID=2316362 RepID=A0A4Q2D654_9AGAR|nr:hypothetical protein EST38_g11848 [Candolleomyces aberdarensis]